MKVVKITQYESDTENEEIIEKSDAKNVNNGVHRKTNSKF